MTITSPDKVLYPRTGFTKRDLADYYSAIADVLLPHVAGRPMTFGRFPDGVEGPGFYQVRCRGRPEFVRTAAVMDRTKDTIEYCVIDNKDGLLWAANIGAIELHPFLWRTPSPDRPDFVVFDLDPSPEVGLGGCAAVAVDIRDRAGREARVKTSGAKGVHVYLRVDDFDWDRAREFARKVAESVRNASPDLVTTKPSLAARRGRVLIDWRQNDPRRSLIAPYSLRGLPVPIASTPVSWDEVEQMRRDARGFRFTPADVLTRIEKLGDLFSTD